MLKRKERELAELVRPAGTPLTKARRLRSLAGLADEHGGVLLIGTMNEDDGTFTVVATIATYYAGDDWFQVPAEYRSSDYWFRIDG